MPLAETLSARAERLTAHATIRLPEGRGPFPFVLQFHGCGGRKRFQDTWAAAFAAAGFAAIAVDSFTPRRIGTAEALATICIGLRLRGAERAGDVFAMLGWAQTQPWAAPGRGAIIGWSHGGWTVLDALATPAARLARLTGLSDLPSEPLDGLAAACVLYPYAGVLSAAGRAPFRTRAALLAVLAGEDSICDPRQASRALAFQRAKGAEVQVETLPGATHAFDEPDARDLRVRFDPALTRKAERLVIDFLKARL